MSHLTKSSGSLPGGARPVVLGALIAALLTLAAAAAPAGDDFDAANGFYDAGKFADARTAYEKVLDASGGSANLYYDLGNTDFRLGSSGRAILDYERALALNPRLPEARENVKLLRERNGSKLLPVSWNQILAAQLSPNLWAVIASVAAWAVLFGLFLVLTSRAGSTLAWWTLSWVGVMAGMAAGIALWSVARDQTRGVITAAQTEARLAPADSAGVAEALPAGSEVRVLSERGSWVYCELPGAGRGWVPQGSVEKVRPGRS